MANFVIKPATGAGNKVVFQNQAGVVDALTVEDSGAIAIAGNTTLSGTANDLGTVTAGTLGTGITYPTGHILQTVSTQSNTSNITTTVTHPSWSAAGHPISMTAIQTNGKYLVNFFSGRIDANHASNHLNLTLYKNENGAGYSTVPVQTTDVGLNRETAGEYRGSAHFTYLYTASITAGQTILFQAYFNKHVGSGTTVYLCNQNYFEFIAQEIQL